MHDQTNGKLRLLARGAEELGISLDGHQLDRFEAYHRELAQWNRRVNLTSVVDYEEVQVKHFLDSLTVCLAAGNPLPPGTRFIDVGAGAGFPGLPLKIAFPHIHLTLVESIGKKADFLRSLKESLALEDVEIHTGRAETLGHDPVLRETFDVVVSRGVARLSTLAEYTLPFCLVGGRVAALKHGGIGPEIESAARALATLGGRLEGPHPVEVTGLDDNRIVLEIEKTGPTPGNYPRRAGIPAKRPL